MSVIVDAHVHGMMLPLLLPTVLATKNKGSMLYTTIRYYWNSVKYSLYLYSGCQQYNIKERNFILCIYKVHTKIDMWMLCIFT